MSDMDERMTAAAPAAASSATTTTTGTAAEATSGNMPGNDDIDDCARQDGPTMRAVMRSEADAVDEVKDGHARVANDNDNDDDDDDDEGELHVGTEVQADDTDGSMSDTSSGSNSRSRSASDGRRDAVAWTRKRRETSAFEGNASTGESKVIEKTGQQGHRTNKRADAMKSPKKKKKKNKKKEKDESLFVSASNVPPTFDYIAKAAVLLVAIGMYIYVFRDAPTERVSPFLDDTLVPFTSFRSAGYGSSWIESDAKRLFRQYARMRSLCWHVSSELGFEVLRQQRRRGVADPDAPRALHGQPDAPFFCVNALLDQFAAGEIYTVHEQQQHRHRAIERMRTVLPTDNIELARQMIDFVSARRDLHDHGAPDVMQPFDSIEEATNEQLGYLDDAVIVRDLAALEQDVAQLQLLDYETLQNFVLGVHRAPGSYQDAACMCGLYYGMPRNMVVTRARNRTLLLLEPEIIRASGAGQLLKSSELPWHTRPIRMRDNLPLLSKAMFVAAGVDPESAHLYHDKLDVVSVALSEESGSGGSGAIRASFIRKLLHISGAQAMCVEHCAFLAAAWSDAADDYHLSPADRLLV